MAEWLRIAADPKVVRRALTTALIVGTILITINHGDALMRGDISLDRLLRMCLTVTVPYMVSTTSSVGAIRDIRRKAVEGRPATQA